MSIRTRLLALVALATLVPAVLVGIRFVHDRGRGIDAAIAELTATAQAVGEDLGEKIQGTAQLHYGLGRARDLHTRDRAACSTFLAAVREEHPQYSGILTIDPDGRLFCDSLRTGRDLDLNDRTYFVNALAAPGGVTLEPAFGRLTGLSVLQIAHPAQAETGELNFVLLASLDLGKFVEAHRRRVPAKQILLFDTAGTVLVWSPGQLRAVPAGTSIADTELFRRVTATSGAQVVDLDGSDGRREVWAVAAVPPDVPAPGLHILVGLPHSDLVAEANRRLIQGTSTLTVISLLLFGGVWTLAERGIRRPVGRIGTMVRKLGDGDLSARVEPPHPAGELGALMGVLNVTAEALERQRTAIDDLHARLRQSQKMEAIGQLTGGVAHDFNNLLTVILGSAELLVERLGKDPESRSLAEMTANAAERGAELTNRLLAFARRQPLDPRPTDINRQIADMDRLLRRTLGEHVEIEVVQAGGLWKAMIDAGQLENAILNLCINARDAMPDGGRLTVETANVRLDAAYAASQSEVEPGQYVMVAVSDTGIGMDAATLERAFEPFFTTKDVGKGSGLGLSMVYGFAKQSGGHVRIYSEAGQGTTVKLYLPRAETDQAPVAAAAEPAIEKGKERILLVEDDDLVRGHVARQLDTLGYEVVAVANGPDAIEALRQRADIDLLFTDIVMPGGMNGREVAERAKALRPGLPVLFTSGYTENAIVHQGRLDRGVHLLQKPYRRQELAAKVRQALRGEQGNDC